MRGDPRTLFMKLENPLFFFQGAEFLPPFASSEYLFGVTNPVSERGGVTSPDLSPTEKLADCLRAGLVILVSGLVCDNGGGPGRRKEF